jgi:hypothetical protein
MTGDGDGLGDWARTSGGVLVGALGKAPGSLTRRTHCVRRCQGWGTWHEMVDDLDAWVDIVSTGGGGTTKWAKSRLGRYQVGQVILARII